MSLNIFVAIPSDERSLVELVLACKDIKTNYPDLKVVVYTDNKINSFIHNYLPHWISHTSTQSEIDQEFDLCIQLVPDPTTIEKLSSIKAKARSGVVNSPHFHIQGSWAQLYMAMIGAKRFSPFVMRDIFCGIIEGNLQTQIHTDQNLKNRHGKIIIDIDAGFRSSWLEIFIQDLYKAYPGRVEELSANVKLEETYIYLGLNPSLSSFISSNGGLSINFITEGWDFSDLASSTLCWNTPLNHPLKIEDLAIFLKLETLTHGHSFRLTEEYLGGLFLPYFNKVIDDNDQLFDLINYVAFNFISSLKDVNIPIPKVTSSLLLKNKGIKSVLEKIIYLNKFGIKFIQDFLNDDNPKHEELSDKIAEIDNLTNRTLQVYQELDLLRLYIQFLKARVPGESFGDIAKNLILTLSEINQLIACINSLLDLILSQSKEKVTTP